MSAAATQKLPAASSGGSARVVVVGAGFAGLAAARTLKLANQGCEVVVLEAPGGRACTTLVSPGLALELGATWLHGLGDAQEPNPIFQHALNFGLIEKKPKATKWWNSHYLLPGDTKSLSTERQAAVTRAMAAWGGVVDGLDPHTAEGTVAEYLSIAWEQLEASGLLGEHVDIARRAWRWRELLQRAMDDCNSTSDFSAVGLASYDEMPGGVHAPIPSGFQVVAERLAAELDVRYGHEVSRVHLGGATGGVTLDCANGSSFTADAAIITLPLGVLKARHAQLFQSPLPAAKVHAIQQLQIGTVDKVFLDFGDGADASGPESRLDEGPVVSYALLWDEQQQAAADELGLPAWARGIFSLRFGGPEIKHLQQGSAAAAGGSGPDAAECGSGVCEPAPGSSSAVAEHALEGRASASSSGGSSNDDEEEWNAEAGVRLPTARQTVVWISGEDATAMEAASDDEVLSVLRRLVDVFPQLQLPAGASWEQAVLHRVCWGSDPRFLGSYSYVAAGATLDDVAALKAPVCKGAGSPLLLFAGEACHVRYIGTTHGAYLTGEEAAQLLLQQAAVPAPARA